MTQQEMAEMMAAQQSAFATDPAVGGRPTPGWLEGQREYDKGMNVLQQVDPAVHAAQIAGGRPNQMTPEPGMWNDRNIDPRNYDAQIYNNPDNNRSNVGIHEILADKTLSDDAKKMFAEEAAIKGSYDMERLNKTLEVGTANEKSLSKARKNRLQKRYDNEFFKEFSQKRGNNSPYRSTSAAIDTAMNYPRTMEEAAKMKLFQEMDDQKSAFLK